MNKWINHLTQNIWSLITRIQNNSYTNTNINKLSSSSSAVLNQSSNNNNVTPMNWWFNLMLISNDINILHLVVIIIKTKDFVMSGNKNEMKWREHEEKSKDQKDQMESQEKRADFWYFFFLIFCFHLSRVISTDWLTKQRSGSSVVSTNFNCNNNNKKLWRSKM